MKKLLAILTAFAMLLSFAACNNDANNTEPTNEVVTENSGETVTEEQGENVTVGDTEESVSATDVTETTAVTELLGDPSTWTTEQIVEFYKNAAVKSKTKVKSVEYKNLEEMVVNDGDGVLGTLVEWVTPFLIKALEDSQVEFDGVTGGYEKIVPSDVKSAKAYKSGEYTVVEMTMKEQTDGIHGDRYSGTVGHAISVVGDISSVAEALSFLYIDFENADIKLHYTQPKLKVRINKDGIIEKGTWSYNIDITVSNLYVKAVKFPIEAMVESGYGTVNYIVTVGGGF